MTPKVKKNELERLDSRLEFFSKKVSELKKIKSLIDDNENFLLFINDKEEKRATALHKLINGAGVGSPNTITLLALKPIDQFLTEEMLAIFEESYIDDDYDVGFIEIRGDKPTPGKNKHAWDYYPIVNYIYVNYFYHMLGEFKLDVISGLLILHPDDTIDNSDLASFTQKDIKRLQDAAIYSYGEDDGFADQVNKMSDCFLKQLIQNSSILT